MLHCDIVLYVNKNTTENTMSPTFILSLFAIATVVVFFKPLLLGLGKAALLVVKPRLTKEEREARAKLRNTRIMQGVINSSSCPSHAAELRAMAARG